MGTTTDRSDPRLTRGVDVEETDQAEVYLVLSDDQIAAGYVRPVRRSYVHDHCGLTTKMSDAIARTYAANPKFYGATYCVGCRRHLPVTEFKWRDGSEVGS